MRVRVCMWVVVKMSQLKCILANARWIVRAGLQFVITASLMSFDFEALVVMDTFFNCVGLLMQVREWWWCCVVWGRGCVCVCARGGGACGGAGVMSVCEDVVWCRGVG